MDWESGRASGRSSEIARAAADAGMDQLVDFPTQVRGNTLDLILTNVPGRVDGVTPRGG